MSDNVKTYKNRKRTLPEKAYQPYIPQYVVEGKEPLAYRSAVIPGQQVKVAKPSKVNPRERRQPGLQSYAAVVPSPLGRGKGPIPNVGNNVEHTWSSVDGQIINDLDDQELDSNHPMVDNNDFVSPAALGISPEEFHMTDRAHSQTNIADGNAEDLFSVVHDLEDDAYLLIVDGVPLCSGPKPEIEEQARALVFGEHEMCDGNPVPDDDIVIIKRVPVKVGLFLG
jgi:hypothetical protein